MAAKAAGREGLVMANRFVHWWTCFGEWSMDAFGPGYHADKILNHIVREVQECRACLRDGQQPPLEEWADLAMLAMDGAQRQNFTANEFVDALEAKLEINKRREWELTEFNTWEHKR